MRQHLILVTIRLDPSGVQVAKRHRRVEDPRLGQKTGLNVMMNSVHSSTVNPRSQGLHVVGQLAVPIRQADYGGLETRKVSSLDRPLGPVIRVCRWKSNGNGVCV